MNRTFGLAICTALTAPLIAPAQPAFEPIAHATGPALNYGLGGAFARDLDGDGLLDLVVSATYEAVGNALETPILILDPRADGRTKAVLAVGGQRAAAYPVPAAPWGDIRPWRGQDRNQQTTTGTAPWPSPPGFHWSCG